VALRFSEEHPVILVDLAEPSLLTQLSRHIQRRLRLAAQPGRKNGIGLEHPSISGTMLDEDERSVAYRASTAEGVCAEFLRRYVTEQVLGHDAHGPPRVHEILVRLHVHPHGEVVQHLYALASGLVESPIPGVLEGRPRVRHSDVGEGHVVRIGGFTIVPEHVTPQVERDRRAVLTDLPRLGEIGHGLQGLIVCAERHEVHELLHLYRRVVAGGESVHSTAELCDSCDHHRCSVRLAGAGRLRRPRLRHEPVDPFERFCAERISEDQGGRSLTFITGCQGDNRHEQAHRAQPSVPRHGSSFRKEKKTHRLASRNCSTLRPGAPAVLYSL
jgi:hypothetical protein